MPYKEIEYEVLAALYTRVERRSTELIMSVDKLASLTGYERDTVIGALIWLKSKGWAEATGPLDIISHGKITPEGRLEHEKRRFRE